MLERPAEIPNLRHLRACLAVARHGGIVPAGAQIGLSQPALTQAVAGVERWAGLPLFDRTPQGLRPNPPGARFLDRVAQGLRHLDRGLAACGARGAAGRAVTPAQLRALIAAVEQGSFRAAARAVGVQTSSISRACRELEARLGAALFEAGPAGSRATRAGEELARVARLMLAELAQARDEAGAWRGAQRGRLAVGSLPLAQARLLPAALARFAAEYPLVECRVVDGYYADLARALRRAEIDILIGALRGADLPQDLAQTALFDDPLALVARAGHPLAQRAPLSLADLAPYGWIAPRAGAPARAYFEALADSGSIDTARPRPIETGAHSVLRGLLAQTDRVTLISRAQVEEEIALGQLTALPVALPDSHRPIGYTLRRDWSPGPIQRRFLDILRAIAATPA
jgi:DNA-binding transcriptional LysR family regulator